MIRQKKIGDSTAAPPEGRERCADQIPMFGGEKKTWFKFRARRTTLFENLRTPGLGEAGERALLGSGVSRPIYDAPMDTFCISANTNCPGHVRHFWNEVGPQAELKTDPRFFFFFPTSERGAKRAAAFTHL